MKFLEKMRRLLVLILIVGSLFGSRSAWAQSSNNVKYIAKPLASLSGIGTLITNEMCLMIRDQKDWDELWARHSGQTSYQKDDEKREKLQVDFGKCVVIAVFGGRLMNYSGVKPYSLSEVPDKVLFRYILDSYQSEAAPGKEPISWTTYGFFVLPRSDKPVVVERAIPHNKGREHVFEPVARFESSGPTFGIYLTEGDVDNRLTVRGEGDWTKLKIASTPIISKSDILSYNPTNYTIRITAEAAARIPRPPVKGKPFVVMVDGQKIYLGVFTTAISSFSFAVPSICVDREGLPKPGGERTLTIDRAYPGENFGKGSDPRPDERIRMSLRPETNK